MSRWVRDELIFNASDNDDVPDGPIWLFMEWKTMNDYYHVIQYHKHTLRSKWVSDELIFNTSDNDDAPESPISFLMEWMTIDNHVHFIQCHKHIPKSKWMRDELIFNASDNDDAPESPILLFLMEWMTIDNQIHAILGFITLGNAQLSEGWVDLQCFWQWWCSWFTNLVAHGMRDSW